MNHLLEIYAQCPILKEPEADLRKVKQAPNEDEMKYFSRFEEAYLRAGSLFDIREKVTAYVDGLHDTLESVLLYMQEHPSATLLEIVRRAKHEGQIRRDRLEQLKPSASSSSSKRAIANLLENSPTCTPAASDGGDSDAKGEVAAVGNVSGNNQGQPGWQNGCGRSTRPRNFFLKDVCIR